MFSAIDHARAYSAIVGAYRAKAQQELFRRWLVWGQHNIDHSLTPDQRREVHAAHSRIEGSDIGSAGTFNTNTLRAMDLVHLFGNGDAVAAIGFFEDWNAENVSYGKRERWGLQSVWNDRNAIAGLESEDASGVSAESGDEPEATADETADVKGNVRDSIIAMLQGVDSYDDLTFIMMAVGERMDRVAAAEAVTV